MPEDEDSDTCAIECGALWGTCAGCPWDSFDEEQKAMERRHSRGDPDPRIDAR